MCGRYKLSVMVKDMAGKANAFFNTGLVTVEVTGNTWASPDPVRLQENLPGPYPIPISQVSLFVPACIQSSVMHADAACFLMQMQQNIT